MTDALEDFTARYRSLAVTTCEWRAFGLSDPETMADAVFAAMRGGRRIDLRTFYRAVEDVVDRTYRTKAGQTSFVEGILTGSLGMLRRGLATDQDRARSALASLPGRDVDALRQRFWDELTNDEMAEVNGHEAATQDARVSAALVRFAAKLPREAAGDPAATMRDLHPGTHRRFAEDEPKPATS